jgi:hypothetical protein
MKKQLKQTDTIQFSSLLTEKEIVNDLFAKSEHHITKHSDIVKILTDFDQSIRITNLNLCDILKKMGCTRKHTKLGSFWNVSKR